MAFGSFSRASHIMAQRRKALALLRNAYPLDAVPPSPFLVHATKYSASSFSLDDLPPPSAPLPRPRSFYSNKRSSLQRRMAAREIPDELSDFHGLAGSTFAEVLERLDRLDQIGLKPHPGTYAGLLQSAGNRVTLENGKLVANHILRYKFDSDMALVGLILQMYRRCRSVEGAREWFDKCEKKNMYMWNCMLATYCQYGRRQEALDFFEIMKKERMASEKECFLSLVSVISGEENLRDGKYVHWHIVRSPYKFDSEVGTGLVRMYGRCGDVASATKMFRLVTDRNNKAWNAMQGAFAQNKLYREAVDLYKVMIEQDEEPDKVGIAGTLFACANAGYLREGMEVYARLMKNPAEIDKMIVISLINLYGNCGQLQEARKIFDAMKEKDRVAWNTLIKVHAEQGHRKQVLELLERMISEGVAPNRVTVICGMSACASLEDLNEGQTIQSQASKPDLESDVGVLTSRILMFGRCGSVDEAREVFNKASDRGLTLSIAMMIVYASNGRMEEALQIFDQMQKDEVLSGDHSYASMLTLCGRSSPVLAYALFEKLPEKSTALWNVIIVSYLHHCQNKQALEMHSEMQKQGVPCDKVTFLNVLSACDEPSTLSEAKRIQLSILGSDHNNDDDILSALVKAFGKCGDIVEARKIFDQIQNQSLSVWGSMISVYAHHGKKKEAFELYHDMQQVGLVPDSSIIVSVFSASSSPAEAADDGNELYKAICQDGLESDPVAIDALMRARAKSGDLSGVKSAFEMAVKPDAFLRASLIGAHAQSGQKLEAEDLYKKLREEELISDKPSFDDVLSAFNYGVLALNKRRHLLSINQSSGFLPSAQTFSDLVDLLGRHGQLNEAEDLTYNEPYVPPNVTYSYLTQENKFNFNFNFSQCF